MFSTDQLFTLRRAGFTDEEINEFQWAVSDRGKPYVTDINTPFWKDVIQARRELIARLEERGITNKADKEAAIKRFYTMKGKADPFDWLKAEYRSPKKLKWQERKRATVRRRVNRRMKKAVDYVLSQREPADAEYRTEKVKRGVSGAKVRHSKTREAAQKRQQQLVTKKLREMSER